MNVMFCDRCGKEIAKNDPHCAVVMQSTPEVVGEMFLGGGESRWDLCRSCSIEVQKLIMAKRTPPPPPKPRIDKPPAVELRGL